MEYTVRELADLAGVTTRTLRWYDARGLLKPERVGDNGYRYYGSAQVDRLQQILFYRELGVELDRIREILDDPAFDRTRALREHLVNLRAEQRRIDAVISAVEENLLAAERNEIMTDEKKFEAFKKKLVADNEEKYGAEARQKYGDEPVDRANANVLGLSQEDYMDWTELDQTILTGLEKAVNEGLDPTGPAGEELAKLHRRWLAHSLGENYDGKKHRGIAQMYVLDERFTAYYDKNVTGCAQFLRDAVCYWIKE